MAEENKENSKKPPMEDEQETLVRVMGFDIPGSRTIYSGLTRIKGVSWAISNAACIKLKIPRSKRVGEFKAEDIKKIEEYLNNLDILPFMKNRISDPETGEESHLFGHDLKLKKEFDVKRMRKMRSYKGIRHGLNLPVRGQRTKSNFRKKGTAVGVRRK